MCIQLFHTDRLHPIVNSVLLNRCKPLTECIEHAEQIETRVKEESDVPKPQQTQMKEEHQEEEVGEEYAVNTSTVDSYFIKSKIARS